MSTKSLEWKLNLSPLNIPGGLIPDIPLDKTGVTLSSTTTRTSPEQKIYMEIEAPDDTIPLSIRDIDIVDEIKELQKWIPGKSVVKCQHCGQWSARFCACPKCGAPVD